MAAEAKYREQCYIRYFSDRITDEKARERSEDTEKRSAFDSLCASLNENDECQYSLAELEDRMNEEGKPTYSRKHLKKMLARRFHHNLICWGKWDVACIIPENLKNCCCLQRSLEMLSEDFVVSTC